MVFARKLRTLKDISSSFSEFYWKNWIFFWQKYYSANSTTSFAPPQTSWGVKLKLNCLNIRSSLRTNLNLLNVLVCFQITLLCIFSFLFRFLFVTCLNVYYTFWTFNFNSTFHTLVRMFLTADILFEKKIIYHWLIND